ncbi:MAG: RNA polymerase sigma factor [Planctomycetota bacterium]|jgi:RNA polymerase sigma-70 factor (ECF subfamily)
MNARTDEQLLADYVSGNDASFELLVRRHARELYTFALRFAGSAVAAEDVVQETLMQVHSSATTFDTSRKLKPWLFTIAANKARDYLRRRNRKRELPFDAHIDAEDDPGRRFLHLFSHDSEPPDSGISVEERRRVVRDVVDGIPCKLREVLIMSYFHRFPYRDIADVLGIPLGTVKSRLHAAIAQFAESYEEAIAERARELE